MKRFSEKQESTVKMAGTIENSESQKRQYIDAESIFDELRRVRKEAAQTRGGMIWREISGGRYLIRTTPRAPTSHWGLRAPRR